MQVKFWGTRGSLPVPGPTTVVYGGNTSCVEVRSSSGTLLILDSGTGMYGLGKELMKNGPRPLVGNILITHTHWDHIQGFPFFEPIFIEGNEWDIYAPYGFESSLEDTLSAQMQYTFFPVTLNQLASHIRYHELIEGVFMIGDITVRTQYLNHPALTLGYRIEADGVAIVYSTDHEPFSLPAALGDIGLQDRKHIEFLTNADLVIHDAQYTCKEYPKKKGWGHSTVQYAMEVCRQAGVKKLALSHYDPSRSDKAVDTLVEEMTVILKEKHSPMEIVGAKEGMIIKLESASLPKKPKKNRSSTAISKPHPSLLGQTLLLGTEDSQSRETFKEAAKESALNISVHESTEDLLKGLQAETPSLILLDTSLKNSSKALLDIKNKESDAVPLVLLVQNEKEIEKKAFKEATDWMIKPFSTQYARTKLYSWLLKKKCRWILPSIPLDEERRLLALKKMNILHTEPEERFDRITRLAQALFNVKYVLISFIEKDKQWFKSCQGILGLRETSRELSFCAHAIVKRSTLIVQDTQLDDRFADNPVVIGEPKIRFYAGEPLFLKDGTCLGTLCIMDSRPREINESDVLLLKDLAELVSRELLFFSPKS